VVVETRVPALPIVVVREGLRLPDAKIRRSRLACVDLLRGVAMLLMALEHTRDFFTGVRFAPEDLAHTSGPLFFTRWASHFCAPIFFFLAGTGGYLSLARGKSVAEVSRFFWTRGWVLVVLDLTVTGYGWAFQFPYLHSGVMWSLGWSMIAMGLLVRLPVPWIGGVGAGIIVGHNLLDHVNPAAFGRFGDLWLMLNGHDWFWLVPDKLPFFVLFSTLPWVGVMAAGYAFGALLTGRWRRRVFWIGACLTFAFLFLRFFHLYGNGQASLYPGFAGAAGPWKVQATPALTIISFFDTLKYPASLQFLLMTLGPALMALAGFDKINPKRGLAKTVLVFGRVPLLFYVLHLYLIHALAAWVALICGQEYAWLMYGGFVLHPIPYGYGHGLPFIYGMWLLLLLLMYTPCKMYAEFKRQHPDRPWLTYF